MSTVKNPHVQAIQAKINRVAQERSVTAPQMMTMFLLERAAVRLMADDKLRSSLIFKGGYVGVRVYNSSRYTTDLDAVIQGLPREEAIQRIKEAMSVDGGGVLKRGWTAAVASIKQAPEFDEAFAVVVNNLKLLDI